MISSRRLLDRIEKGKLGLNKGLPHGFDRLTEFIPNTQQSTYYVVGGELGSGKSALTNNMFVYNPIDWYIANKHNTDIKLSIKYYSFEIPKDDMGLKALARKIYLEYGVLLDINYILSRGKYRVSDEHYRLVRDNLSYIDEVNSIVDIQDLPKNPTGIWYDMLGHAMKNGKGLKENKDQYGNKTYEFENEYIPNDPNLYTLIIVDHVGLAKKEREFNKKEVIDKLSEYMIILRNKCGFSPVVVQQLNRSISSSDRFKLDRVEPQLSDFKESGCTQEDANVVLALFSPQRYELEKYRNYDVRRLKNRFRSLSILKNRDGDADKVLGLKFIGEVGYFEELPKADDMTENVYGSITGIKKSYTE